MYECIVTAYDGSDGARSALRRAAEIAGRDGASLTVVESVPESLPALVPGAPKPAEHRGAAEARTELREAVAALDPALEASPWAVGGPAGKAIVTVAEDLGADLIVCGSRNKGRLERAVLGSVATEVLHAAHCDVLVVQPAD